LALYPNQNIELIIVDNEDERIYRSRVEDISEGHVLVAVPIYDGSFGSVRPQTEVKIAYTENDLRDQGRYEAQGVVLKHYNKHNVPMLLIELTSSWQRIQMRHYVRVNVLIDAVINSSQKCLVKDLSGGGLLFLSEEYYAVGQTVKIDFTLEQTYFRLEGVIVRVVPGQNGNEYGMSFINLDDKTRQQIIEFVFKRQIDAYRKRPIKFRK